MSYCYDVPQHSRTDNDVSGLSPNYTPAAGNEFPLRASKGKTNLTHNDWQQ